jgi:molecular chaperone GrpE
MPVKKNSKKSNTETKSQLNSNIKPEHDKLAELKYTQEISQLKAQLETQNAEIEDWKNKSFRISADLQNFQKQSELDLNQAKKVAKKAILQNILPFLNTLNISFSYIPTTEDPKVVAFNNTLKGSFEKLISELKNANIDIITAQTGELFNPDFMNILNSDFESNDEKPTVKQVVSVGLKIDGQLIQPLSVIVG